MSDLKVVQWKKNEDPLQLVQVLEEMLKRAREGSMKGFVGAELHMDGQRFRTVYAGDYSAMIGIAALRFTERDMMDKFQDTGSNG